MYSVYACTPIEQFSRIMVRQPLDASKPFFPSQSLKPLWFQREIDPCASTYGKMNSPAASCEGSKPQKLKIYNVPRKLGRSFRVRPTQITRWEHCPQKEIPEIFSVRRAKREPDQEAFQAQLY